MREVREVLKLRKQKNKNIKLSRTLKSPDEAAAGRTMGGMGRMGRMRI